MDGAYQTMQLMKDRESVDLDIGVVAWRARWEPMIRRVGDPYVPQTRYSACLR